MTMHLLWLSNSIQRFRYLFLQPHTLLRSNDILYSTKDTFIGKSGQLVLDILWGMKGLDILRPSRSNDAKHPMSGTRLMKDNILYANIIRDEICS